MQRSGAAGRVFSMGLLKIPDHGVPGSMAKHKPARRSWVLILFGLPFLGVGLGVLVLGPLDTLRLHYVSAGWERVPVRIQHVELVSSRSDDSTTYKVAARYTYAFDGQTWHGTRVGYATSSDSLREDHQRVVNELRRVMQRGETYLAWVNPADPQQAFLVRELRWKYLVFMAIFGVVFTLAGAGVIAFGVWSGSATAELENSGPIYSTERRSFWLWWGMGTMFWLLPMPGLIELPAEWRAGNHAILLVLLFPLVGSLLLWRGTRVWRNWRYYGPLPIQLDPQPGQVGGDVGGRIMLRMPWRAENPFTVTLQCLYSRVTGSGKNRSRSESLVWQAEQLPYLRAAAGGTELQFVFQPPAHLPQSEPRRGNYHCWRILLNGTELPVPLERTYTIPVLQGTEKARLAIPARDSAQLARQAQLRALEQAGEQIRVSRAGGGVQIHSPFGLHIGMKLMLLVFGVVFAGAAVFLTYVALAEGGMLWFMAGVFSLFGFPLLLAGMFVLGRSLKVEVRNGTLRSVRYWFGLPLWKRQLNLQRAEQLKAVSSGGKLSDGRKHTEYFHLFANEAGRKVRVAEDIAGREAAEALRENLVQLLGLRM